MRAIHLPPFLVDLLAQLRHRRPDTEFVFTGADGGLHRGSDPTSAVIGEEGTDAAFWAGSTVRGDRQLPESGGCCRWPEMRPMTRATLSRRTLSSTCVSTP
jgi:hypothetical protein